jgi:hypothetical protein
MPLPPDHPTSVAFLDETGAIAQDRFFAVGCADPIRRFGTPWRAYEKLAAQLLIGSIVRDELVSVLADFFSTPHHVNFEMDVRAEVNRRLRRCAVTTMCRLDSRTADPLQVVDLLTSAVAFEFRQAEGLAGEGSAKANLAQHVRDAFGVATFLDLPVRNSLVNVRMYRERNS